VQGGCRGGAGGQTPTRANPLRGRVCSGLIPPGGRGYGGDVVRKQSRTPVFPVAPKEKNMKSADSSGSRETDSPSTTRKPISSVRRLMGWVALIALLSLPLGVRTMNAWSPRPEGLGVREGRLSPCPASPNCVSTQDGQGDQAMDPLRWEGSAKDALDRFETIIRGLPRTKIITRSENYLHAEFKTAWLGFIDDVEILVSPEKSRIDFRSASRVGYSDLGVNRKRMQDLVTRFQATESAAQ